MKEETKKKHPILFEIVDLLTDPAVIVGGIGLALMAGGATSIGLLATGKITGDFAGLLALGGGFAGFALGGNILYGATQISADQKDVRTIERKTKEQSHTRENVHNMTHNLSKMAEKAESKQDGLITQGATKGKTPEERMARQAKAKALHDAEQITRLTKRKEMLAQKR